jgi:tetraacyldisaccharide 4'-kinase
MQTPKFWYAAPSKKALLLRPFSWVFMFLGWLRQVMTKPITVKVPVICVGNLVAGGAGKTPVVQTLVRFFKGRGYKVAVISRGYGGCYGALVVKVDPSCHSAREVGDEPLIHAALTDTYVGKNRGEAARHAAQEGAEIIILDDGLQNPSLTHSLRLCVVDAHKQFGNGYIIPAGPLRQDLQQGVKSVDGFVVLGEEKIKLEPTVPILQASTVMNKEDWAWLRGKKAVAFAGLAHPEKFFNLLHAEGVAVLATQSFADHHLYTAGEINQLRQQAEHLGAVLITTEKDWVRLSPKDQQAIQPIRIHLELQDHQALRRLLGPILERQKGG